MTVTCTKLSGAGNTFLFFDARTSARDNAIFKFFRTRSRSRIAQILCDGHHSIGADGVVFVEKSVNKVNNFSGNLSRKAARVHLQWDFYNADGSSAEMCGNAARCMALYARKLGFKNNNILFQTRAGVISAKILKNSNKDITEVRVAMPQVSSLKLEQKISVGKSNIMFTFVNSGVPHAVIEVGFSLKSSALSEKNRTVLENIDRVFKSHKYFKPKSTNVTFFKVLKAGHIESLTYERGVKGYTQACGTGAVAAALAYRLNHFDPQKVSRIKLTLPGGTVWVNLSGLHPLLTGPAKDIADITLSR